MSADSLFDPSRSDFIANPYSAFARLRTHDPVHWSAQHRMWIPTRYQDIKLILSDARFGAPENAIENRRATQDSHAVKQLEHAAHHAFDFWMVNRNPPDHTRLRALLAPWFSKNAAEEWRPVIAARIDHLLTRAQSSGAMDVLADFADDLAFTTICEIMAIPPADRPALQMSVREMLGLLGFNRSPQERARAVMATLNAVNYFERLKAARASAPGQDLFSALVLAQRDGTLSAEELTTNAVMLMVGGEANTRAALGNSVLALLQNPEQLAWLRAHPGQMRQAIEELLRFENSKQIVARVVLREVQLGSKVLHRGDMVRVLPGAANHDPEIFSEPDRLELRRAMNPHASFGFGIHYCLGAYLARLELEMALTALLERFPRLTLEPSPLQWRKDFFPRGVHTLRVRF